MKSYAYSATFITAIFINSCQKTVNDKASPEDIARANEFKNTISEKRFQLREYYSDVPIDYIDSDNVVKAETQLWKYVSPWLKDDSNLFVNNAIVRVEQGSIKMPGLDSAVILRSCIIGADLQGPYMDFLSHEYHPLKYRLKDFTDSSFTIYAVWHNKSTVYSKFEMKNN